MAEPVEPTAAVPYPNAWFVPQFRTEEILRERLAELGGHVELATELADFTQDPDGVTATLLAGGATETVRVKYLVGADGGRSTVRKRLGIAFPGETDETTTMLFADARVDGVSRDHGYIWQLGDGGVSVTPLAGTDLFVLTARTQDDPAEPVRDYLQRQIAEASGRDDIVVREITWHTTWRHNARLAERFRDGRAFLAGDAGHVHPPTGGQGMNTGVQDGYNLGWKLAAALAGASDVLLDSYEPERMATARTALELSTAVLEKYRRGDEDAHLRGPEMHGLTLNYRTSPLSRDDRAHPGELTAGDRAPDASVTTSDGRQARLFDLFRGPQWTLLGFGAALDVTVTALGDQLGLPSYTLIDGDYDAAEGTLLLIRPDGYVGLATDSAGHVTDYWTSLYGAPVAPATA
jgi:2-polyprenyl-6-methoxyphenol hydroxylase-like FAD-dependent oxidoreductase